MRNDSVGVILAQVVIILLAFGTHIGCTCLPCCSSCQGEKHAVEVTQTSSPAPGSWAHCVDSKDGCPRAGTIVGVDVDTKEQLFSLTVETEAGGR